MPCFTNVNDGLKLKIKHMANQMADGRKRTVYIVDKEDYYELEAYAKKMGFTTSVLLREATFRLAEELRNTGKTQLVRQPKDNEGRRNE